MIWELSPQTVAGDSGERFLDVEVPGTIKWLDTPSEDLWPPDPSPRELQWTDVANRILQYVPDYNTANSPRFIYGTNWSPEYKYYVAGNIADEMKPYEKGTSSYEILATDRARHVNINTGSVDPAVAKIVTKPPVLKPANLDLHWELHGHEFFTFYSDNKELYRVGAIDLLYGKQNLKFFRRQESADIVAYDESRNFFEVVGSNWEIDTFFRPDEQVNYFNADKLGAHGYPPEDEPYQ